MLRIRLLASSIALLLGSSSAFATNGYFSHGYGMKAKGMAGVGIALPQDSIAAATNPAGMALIGDRADLGLDVFKPSRGAEVIAFKGAGRVAKILAIGIARQVHILLARENNVA